MRDVFVQTRNVKTFYGAVKEAEAVRTDPALLVCTGQAGRGKTTAARALSAQEGWVYVRGLTMWSELWMLQDLCFELGIDPIPGRKKACFEAIRARLIADRRAVILDEADKLTLRLLEVVRDLADVTLAPWALLGEKTVKLAMARERRIWSRTLRHIEFGPIQPQDIMFFAKEAAGIALKGPQAATITAESEGDFRLAVRAIRHLERIMQANAAAEATDKLVDAALAQGLRGRS